MKYILATTALLTSVVAAPADFATRSGYAGHGGFSLECAVTRVTPPDLDKNPGYKVNLGVDAGENMISLSVIHALADGTTIDRSAQYKNNVTLKWVNSRIVWSGYYYNGNLMTGTLYYLNDNNITYTEVIRKKGRIETTIETRCHME